MQIGDIVLYRLRDDSATRPAIVLSVFNSRPARIKVFLDQPTDRNAEEAVEKGADGFCGDDLSLGFLRNAEVLPGQPAPGCWCARPELDEIPPTLPTGEPPAEDPRVEVTGEPPAVEPTPEDPRVEVTGEPPTVEPTPDEPRVEITGEELDDLDAAVVDTEKASV